MASTPAAGWRATAAYAALSPFSRGVLELCAAIPRGRVTTYAALGAALRGPGARAAQQAVGNALRANPFAPTVPCHRIVRGGPHPSLGGFMGASEERGAGAASSSSSSSSSSSVGGASSASERLSRKLTLLREEGVRFDEAPGPRGAPPSLRLLEPERCLLTDPREFGEAALSAARALVAQTNAAPAHTQAPSPAGSGSAAPRPAKRAKAGTTAAAAPAEGVAAALHARLSAPGATGADVRAAARSGELDSHTSGLAPGFAQANLVVVPREHASYFKTFCERNPQACPLLEATAPGSFILAAGGVAPGADVRRDLPGYRIWRDGVPGELLRDISHIWPQTSPFFPPPVGSGAQPPPDFQAFLIGCSFSFEEALLRARLPVRHLQQPLPTAEAASKRAPGAAAEEQAECARLAAAGATVSTPRCVPMYVTSRANVASGPFGGRLVVSMRPMTPTQAERAAEVTAAFPRVHGAPVAFGPEAAAELGIADLSRPDFGDLVSIFEGEVPVFWACGVTPQEALREARLPLAVMHAPGHMLVLDALNASLRIASA